MLNQYSHKNTPELLFWIQALRLAGGHVLEPVMSLEVIVLEEHLSSVLGDLAKRRGTVRDIQSRHDNKVLLATVPLAEMMVRGRSDGSAVHVYFWFIFLKKKSFHVFCTLKGYSTTLRTLTSGTATFSLELDTYEAMNPQDQNSLLKKMSGLL